MTRFKWTLIELLDYAFVQRILSDKSELSAALAYTGSLHPNAALQVSLRDTLTHTAHLDMVCEH